MSNFLKLSFLFLLKKYKNFANIRKNPQVIILFFFLYRIFYKNTEYTRKNVLNVIKKNILIFLDTYMHERSKGKILKKCVHSFAFCFYLL